MEGGSGLNLLYVETYDAMVLSRGQANFCTKMLTFEIADFPGAYHAILGQPCYAKFMAIPNYTYLKHKMPGPRRVITIGGDLQQAHLCERENYDITTTVCQPLGA
ncbi:uncharacterized protein [Miscanthus floridulus]|uniref:uncharacterized protein n=1 Tax=Miscanthus floridulus TaxID=154761 RepID=UPI0034598FB5